MYLSPHLNIKLFIHIFRCFIYLSNYVFLSIFLFIYLSINLFIYLYIYLGVEVGKDCLIAPGRRVVATQRVVAVRHLAAIIWIII